MQGASVLAYLSEIIPVSAWQGFNPWKVKFNSLRPSDIWVSNIIIIGSDNGLSPRGTKSLSEPMLEYC